MALIAANSARGKRIAVFGLGGSGLVSARSLDAGGAEIFCFDDNPQSVKAAKVEGLNTVDLRQIDFSTIDELVLAPGVPLTHPKPHWSVELAKAAKVPVIGDIELFCRERRAKAPNCGFIAITGTNGKSTTTALIGHIIRNAGLDLQLGGNIGTPVLSLEEPRSDQVYVVECSSYQIDLAPDLDPGIGILLNLSPDHLDRHGTMENYAQVKSRLVEKADFAIIGADDAYCEKIADRLENDHHQIKRIAGFNKLENGVFYDQGKLYEADDKGLREIFDFSHAPALRGAHNGQNAASAWLTCKQTGLSEEAIIAGLTSFPGLAHRMELVGKIDNLWFVNDSKATNADAAHHALASFDQIYWIAGGLAKQGGIEILKDMFPKIAKAYLIGEAAPQFAVTLGEKVPYEISGTLENAVKQANFDAQENAQGEAVVLFSPACASFDQYQNFEKRGDAFRDAVMSLDRISVFAGSFKESN